MRVALSLVIVAGCACSALALDGKPAPAQPAEPATPATAAIPAEPAEPAAPSCLRPIPVPNLPVLKKTVLEGGLIVEDMKLGEGYEVTTGGAVVAHYHGTLKADPTTVFDSSFNRGEPVALPLSSVIPGWQKGVPGMKVGGIRRLTVPAAMAYGEKSPSPEIPANSDLVFVLQIVDALRVEDLRIGTGDLTATSPCVAITTYTITDKNGKVLEKHDAGDPYIWVLGEYQAISLGMEGMKIGGKRKIMVPAAFNQPNSRFAPTRPANVPVTIEVELLNLRNIPAEALKQSQEPGC